MEELLTEFLLEVRNNAKTDYNYKNIIPTLCNSRNSMEYIYSLEQLKNTLSKNEFIKYEQVIVYLFNYGYKPHKELMEFLQHIKFMYEMSGID